MAGLPGQPSTIGDKRKASARRQVLRLAGSLINLESALGGPSAMATIMNISPTGVLVETDLSAHVDQLLRVDLGAAGRHEAIVRWVDGRLLGCEFPKTLSRSHISAALLQGEHHGQALAGKKENLPAPLLPTTTQRDFGLAIAWARNAKGVNQAELARAVGVSTTTICKWERGHSMPRAGALARLQEFLQDAETSGAQPTRVQAKTPRTASADIHDIVSECRARLSDYLGLNLEAVDVQIVINALKPRERKRDGQPPSGMNE